MNAAEKIRKRLHDLADQIDPAFASPEILPTLETTAKGIDALEKIVGYCGDKLKPTPLEDRASPARLASRAARVKTKTTG